MVQRKQVDPVIVSKEKDQAVRRNRLLEIIETKEALDSISGLDVLKQSLLKRHHAFSKRAIDYGLPTPKGLLIRLLHISSRVLPFVSRTVVHTKTSEIAAANVYRL